MIKIKIKHSLTDYLIKRDNTHITVSDGRSRDKHKTSNSVELNKQCRNFRQKLTNISFRIVAFSTTLNN